jgi:predicted nucleotidyltransferase component of viral defense system
MNSVPDRALIEEVALEKGINPAFVEKDWYVTQIIRLVAAFKFEDFRMIFTGGTALSKAHDLLERFSEDIDFRAIGPTLEGLNNSQLKKKLSELKHKVFAHIAGDFPITEENLTARNGNRFFAIELDYPTVFDRSLSLRPHVLIEFTVTTLALPAIALPVSSFIAALAKNEPRLQLLIALTRLRTQPIS